MWDRKSMAHAVLGRPYELPAWRAYNDEMVVRLDAGRRADVSAARNNQNRVADEWLAAITQLSLYGKRRHRHTTRSRQS